VGNCNYRGSGPIHAREKMPRPELEVMNGFAGRSCASYVVRGESSVRFGVNSKAGGNVARRRFTPEQLQQLQQVARAWGKMVARRAFGADGPGLDVDFDAMEQVAQAAAAGLTEGTLQTLLEQQSAALGAQQPCPDCGRLCSVRRQPRPLKTRGAHLQQDEPVCHCPDCRRDFFPPTADPAPGRPRLYPGGPPQDPD